MYILLIRLGSIGRNSFFFFVLDWRPETHGRNFTTDVEVLKGNIEIRTREGLWMKFPLTLLNYWRVVPGAVFLLYGMHDIWKITSSLIWRRIPLGAGAGAGAGNGTGAVQVDRART